MAITLNAKVLTDKLDSLTEDTEVVYTSSDKWESGTYKRKTTVFGTVRTWTLAGSEDNVVWGSSDIKSLQTSAASNASVNFTCTDPPHVLNLSVYITKVSISYDPGAPTHRIFEIELVEAM